MKYPLAAFVAVVLLAGTANAHPPDSIASEFDTLGQVLKIRIMHHVKDPAKHYVYKVAVEMNGKKKIEQLSSRQLDNMIQELVYRIVEAAIGDKITVTAYCNVTGKKKVDLIVEPGLMNPPPK